MKQSFTVFAIDPGPEMSAYLTLGDSIGNKGYVPNDELRQILRTLPNVDLIAIENIASYGMPVGQEVFDTCRWIGRFEEVSKAPVMLIFRHEVKLHLCYSPRAKDSNIRQALLDKYGPQGTKKNPGVTYGISGDVWAALAVADCAMHKLREEANLHELQKPN